MDEQKILLNFIKNPTQKYLVDLIRTSIHFNVEEKFYLINDLLSYTDEQIKKLIKILETEYQANKILAQKYPKKFKEKKVLTKKNWEAVLIALKEKINKFSKDKS